MPSPASIGDEKKMPRVCGARMETNEDVGAERKRLAPSCVLKPPRSDWFLRPFEKRDNAQARCLLCWPSDIHNYVGRATSIMPYGACRAPSSAVPCSLPPKAMPRSAIHPSGGLRFYGSLRFVFAIDAFVGPHFRAIALKCIMSAACKECIAAALLAANSQSERALGSIGAALGHGAPPRCVLP